MNTGQLHGKTALGGIKEMAMFGLRKAFIDPAPKPRQPSARMERYFGCTSHAMDFWVPE